VNIGIVTNLNGRGLERDARLITPLIESRGHTVELLQYDEPCDKSFPLLIFLEITPRNLIGLSEAPPWLIVNPEFLKVENVKLVERHFGKVLCKTHEAHRICSELFGEMAVYIGFMSADKFDPTIRKQKKFLYIAGKSRAKGTEPVSHRCVEVETGRQEPRCGIDCRIGLARRKGIAGRRDSSQQDHGRGTSPTPERMPISSTAFGDRGMVSRNSRESLSKRDNPDRGRATDE